jgi:hypothetical protein
MRVVLVKKGGDNDEADVTPVASPHGCVAVVDFEEHQVFIGMTKKEVRQWLTKIKSKTH